MPKLNDLSPAARSAAMRGGISGWGQWSSASAHIRYMEPANQSRRKCLCGCKKRVTHRGMANGITLLMGCELTVRRWIKEGYANRINRTSRAQA
jgi:hypothetical protein